MPGSNNVTILLGNGSGGFAPVSGSPFAVAGSPFSVAVADFNGDGIQDLVTPNWSSNTISVLLGNGAGGFTPATGSPFYVGAAPAYVAAGDFNGDGIPDVAVAFPGGVAVLLGNGSGGFSTAEGSPFATGANPRSVVVADFNGDGFEDLATANQIGSNITVLLGNGTGNFTAAPGSPLALAASPSYLVVGDFNGDGASDLAVDLPDGVTILLEITRADLPLPLAISLVQGAIPISLSAISTAMVSRISP